MRTRQKGKILEISDALFLTASFAAYTPPAASFLSSVESGSVSRRFLEEKSHKPVHNIFGRESKTRIHFESSHMSEGLQIADVVANSVFQSLSPLSYAGQTAKELLQPLLAAQVLPGNHLTDREL